MKERGELGETTEGFSINLRNCSGVPVLEFIGEMNKAGIAALGRAISSLADAGHYHLVVNIEKAAELNTNAISLLNRAAKAIRSHYGSIDIVTRSAQVIETLSRNGFSGLIRFCASEGQALQRIKRLPELPDTAYACREVTTARMVERI